MIKELFGKIKNKPDTDSSFGTVMPVGASMAHMPTSSGKDDIVMDQIKMLIEINKNLNEKMKRLDTRVNAIEASMEKHVQVMEALMERLQAQAPQEQEL